MNRTEAQARWKNNPVTLSSWSYMRPTFHLDSSRTRERESEAERLGGDKERKEEGESVPLHSPILAMLSIFVSSFCACSTHTLTVQWIFNLALISCAPDETNTDSLFTFVKAPAAAVLVPHTHTHRIRGLAPAGAYRKSRLCTKWPDCTEQLLSLTTLTHTPTQCVMFR